MDELAIVEPHGADRLLIASTRRRSSALVAVTGQLLAPRPGQPRPARARRRAARHRPDRGAARAGRAARRADSGRSSSPTTNVHSPISWNEAVLRWQRTGSRPYVTVTRALLTGGATLALARVYLGSLVGRAAAARGGASGDDPTRSASGGAGTRSPPIGGHARRRRVAGDPRRRSRRTPSLGIPTASAIAARGARPRPRRRTSCARRSCPSIRSGAALMLAVDRDLRRHRSSTELIARRLEAPVGAIGPSIALVRRGLRARIGSLGADDRVLRARRRRVSRRAAALRDGDAPHLVPEPRATAARSSSPVARPRARSSSRPRSRSGRGCRARAERRGSSTGRSGRGKRFERPQRDLAARLGRRQAQRQGIDRRGLHRPDHRAERQLLARDRARPVPERRLGPQLRPSVRRSKLPGPTARPRHDAGHPDVPARQHRRRTGSPPRTARSTSTRPARRSCRGSTSLFLDNPLVGPRPTPWSRRSPIPTSRSSKSVTDADLGAMAADTALPDNFSPARPNFAAGRDRATRTTPYDKAIALDEGSSSRRRSSTTRRSTSGPTRARSTSSSSRRTAASASSTPPRSPSSPVRSVCRRGSRSATSRGTLGRDGLWHVEEKDAHAWPEVWLGADRRLVPLRADARPHRPRHRLRQQHRRRRDRSRPRPRPRRPTAESTTPTTASLTPNSTPNQLNVQPPSPPASPSHARGHVVT